VSVALESGSRLTYKGMLAMLNNATRLVMDEEILQTPLNAG